ncbi:MAG: hypothetical protein K8U03_09965 [Planctomycetia bacterium]|nr:hypothetical protein [Planctomycetia bacterium]
MRSRTVLISLVIANAVATIAVIAWAELSLGGWSLSFFYDHRAFADPKLSQVMVSVQQLCRRIEIPLIATNIVWFCLTWYALAKPGDDSRITSQ